MNSLDDDLPKLTHLEWCWIELAAEFNKNLPSEAYIMLRAAFAVGARSTFDAITVAMQAPSPDRAVMLAALHDELNMLINEISPTQGSC
jgi:hypothetical protein